MAGRPSDQTSRWTSASVLNCSNTKRTGDALLPMKPAPTATVYAHTTSEPKRYGLPSKAGARALRAALLLLS